MSQKPDPFPKVVSHARQRPPPNSGSQVLGLQVLGPWNAPVPISVGSEEECICRRGMIVWLERGFVARLDGPKACGPLLLPPHPPRARTHTHTHTHTLLSHCTASASVCRENAFLAARRLGNQPHAKASCVSIFARLCVGMRTCQGFGE